MKDLMIRLKKRKSTSHLSYDIVVMHKYKRPKADYFERLGVISYAYPNNIFFLNINRVSFWLAKGAVFSHKASRYLMLLFPAHPDLSFEDKSKFF